MARDHSQMSPGRAAASFPDQQSTERESFRRGLLMWLRLDRGFVRRDVGAGGLDTTIMSLESGNWVRYKGWGRGQCENYIREPRLPCHKKIATKNSRRCSEEVLI
jgi:hypothetical protein